MGKYTPMMEQYLSIKNEYKNYILLFRLGDFYEMFFDDAILASKALDLTLTGRDCGEGERAPMCGVPFHAAENYVARLIEKGFKVAICEQTEDAQATKTLVKREVVRVISPGTTLDSANLKRDRNNYIASIYYHKGFGLSYCDITTGQFMTATFEDDERLLFDELARLSPAEIITNGRLADKGLLDAITEIFKVSPQIQDDRFYFPDNAQRRLLKHFNLQSLMSLGIEDDNLAICASGALLSYLYEMQKDVAGLWSLKPYHISDFMFLDMSTRRNLEINRTIWENTEENTLFAVLNDTITPMGARLLREWLNKPLINIAAINARLDGVSAFFDNGPLRQEVRRLLAFVCDMERIVAKITYKSVGGRDLVALKNTINTLPAIKRLVLGVSELEPWFGGFDTLGDVGELIESTIVDEPPALVRDGGVIKPGVSAELDSYREAQQKGKDWLLNLETELKEESGIKSLKIKYNRVFGYFIEITNSYLNQVPDTFIRRQTLANCERFTIARLKEIEDMIINADERILRVEVELFNEFVAKIAALAPRISESAKMLAQGDVLSSIAEVSKNHNYIRPIVDDGDEILLKEARHPVIERSRPFISNDLLLDRQSNRLIILTGPNMGGKSTFMRQTALVVLMAQAGFFVPAKSAKIGVVDRIFTRINAHDNLSKGQSTFMVEMNEVSNILNGATKRSLLILDEIGRGTSTFDGLSIAWAVLEHIQKLGAPTLFATHYHELTRLEGRLTGVRNCSVSVAEQGDEVVFLYKIVDGGVNSSYGVQVARLAGLPGAVVDRAGDLLKLLNMANAGTIEQVEDDASYESRKRKKKDSPYYFNGDKRIDLSGLTPMEMFSVLLDQMDTGK